VLQKECWFVLLLDAPIFSVFHEFFGLRLLFSALCHLQETKFDGDHDGIYALEDSLAQLAAHGLASASYKTCQVTYSHYFTTFTTIQSPRLSFTQD
jgi:hypothetical protein